MYLNLLNRVAKETAFSSTLEAGVDSGGGGLFEFVSNARMHIGSKEGCECYVMHMKDKSIDIWADMSMRYNHQVIKMSPAIANIT